MANVVRLGPLLPLRQQIVRESDSPDSVLSAADFRDDRNHDACLGCHLVALGELYRCVRLATRKSDRRSRGKVVVGNRWLGLPPPGSPVSVRAGGIRTLTIAGVAAIFILGSPCHARALAATLALPRLRFATDANYQK